MVAVTKRSLMTLFSGPSCPNSHRIRLVLAEKGITAEIQQVHAGAVPEDLLDLNPYGSVPTLVDRELALYDATVIAEYLDERFPHPPLMPVDPVSRAKARLVLYRIEQDWCRLILELEAAGGRRADDLRLRLRDSLSAGSDLFSETPYFLSEEFSAMDCAVAPLLWRLPFYRVSLPPEAAPILDYAERMFARESFQSSLSDAERRMRG